MSVPISFLALPLFQNATDTVYVIAIITLKNRSAALVGKCHTAHIRLALPPDHVDSHNADTFMNYSRMHFVHTFTIVSALSMSID